jgi:hypothetical protein
MLSHVPVSPIGDLDSLQKSFSSEMHLHRAIAKLLSRMPHTSNVQILHGRMEKGKDIIFFTPSLTGPLLNACVIKNMKITGNVEASTGARTIFHQAEIALDSTYTNENGQQLRVKKVYIITPFAISQDAISSIESALDKHAVAIEFVAGPQLFDLFKEFYDDYLTEEYALMSQELDTLHTTLDRSPDFRSLQAHYNVITGEKPLRSIYVPPEYCKALQRCRLNIASGHFSGLNFRLVSPSGNVNNERLRLFVKLVDELTLINDLADVLDPSIHQNLEPLLTKADVFRKAASEELSTHLADDTEFLIRQGSPLAEVSPLYEKDVATFLVKLDRVIIDFGEVLKSLPSGTTFGAIPVQVRRQSDSLHYYLQRSFIADTTGETSLNVTEDELYSIDRAILIVAPAGYGKSSFCRWHALNDLEALAAGRSNVVPVFVPLHQLKDGDNLTVEGTFLRFAGRSALLEQELSGSMTARPLRLYLDGLDEIPDKRTQATIVDLALKASMLPDCRVILTSRDYVHLKQLRELERISLKGFTDKQVTTLVHKWLGSADEIQVIRFEREIFHSSLYELMRIPLLATLTLLLYNQTKRLPENKIKLYENFTELLNGGWDLVKGVQRQLIYSSGQKAYFLKALAFTMHVHGKRELSTRDIRLKCEAMFHEQVDVDTFLNETLIDGLLTKIGSTFEFAHLSFQEFFAAKSLIGNPDRSALDKVKTDFNQGSDWWKEVLIFYAGLGGRPMEFLQWLKPTAGPGRGETLRVDVMKLFPYLK